MTVDLAQGLPSTKAHGFKLGVESNGEKQMSLGKIAIATTTFACTALISFSWSEQRGVSLSIESAQARVGRPLTPVSVAGVARRQDRRAAYGYGAGAVGAGLAAAAIGTAAVAATSPYGYYGGGPYVGTGWGWGGGPYAAAGIGWGGGPYVAGGGYYRSSTWGDHESYPTVVGARPYAAKDWGANWRYYAR